jgi:hypothetical protein
MRNDVPLLVVALAALSLAAFGVFAWAVSRFLRLWSRLLETSAARAEALGRLAAAAERLAQVVERTGLSPRPASAAPSAPPAAQQGPASRPTDAETLRAQLEAAREASDPGRVLEIRETLVTLLEPEQRAALDRPLARWFLDLIQKRLRQGAIAVDVVALATRVAAALDTTPEGASLRAALPTLRRSVGLCARCGNPYTGIADACPACLTAGLPTVSGGPASPSRSVSEGGPPNGTPLTPEADSQGSEDAPA